MHIIINSQYNYRISHKGLLQQCHKQHNVAVTVLLLPPPVTKADTKRSSQCPVFSQSPPDRRPNDKYPVNTSHRSDLCKNVSLQCYLVATVIHIQSVCSQICVCTHVVHNMATVVGLRK